jgi:hypothetical protein
VVDGRQPAEESEGFLGSNSRATEEATVRSRDVGTAVSVEPIQYGDDREERKNESDSDQPGGERYHGYHVPVEGVPTSISPPWDGEGK